MGLDIRVPIGLLFSVLGLMLTGFGIATSGSDIYLRSLGNNVNLTWGVIMLAFGVIMLLLGRRGLANAAEEIKHHDHPDAPPAH